MLPLAFSAVAGSLTATFRPSIWMLVVSLSVWMIINHWLVRWSGRQALVAMALVFLMCASRHAVLIQRGHEAKSLHAGEISTVDVTVRQVKAAGENGWGRAIVRLGNGSLAQLEGSVAHLMPGQKIRVVARFAAPSPVRNPGGFDEARHLAGQGVFLKAELLLDRITFLDSRSEPIQAVLIQVRRKMADVIRLGLSEREGALLMGILIGDTGGMTAKDREAFRLSGLSHLTAVSGANVAFVLIPALSVFKLLIWQRRHIQVFAILFLIGFGSLTGWEPSVTRAILMTMVVMAGRLTHRRSDPINALLLAITIMLLVHPEQVIAASFQLSFLATSGILLLREPIQNWLDKKAPIVPAPIQTILAVNLAVQIAVLPVGAGLSHQIAPFSVLANLLAMPLAEGATLMGAVGFACATPALAMMSLVSDIHAPAIWLTRAIFWPTGCLLEALTHLAEWFAAPFWPRLPIAEQMAPVLATTAYFSAVLSLLIHGRRKIQMKLIAAVITFSCLLLFVFNFINRPELEVIMFDVGQGDATLIRTKHGPIILVDAGTETAGRQVVMPALLALGISRIDLAIVTHGHRDHAGGFLPLLEQGMVRSLAVSQSAYELTLLQIASMTLGSVADGMEQDLMKQLLEQAHKRSIPVQALQKGDTMRINQTTDLSILAPATSEGKELLSRSKSRGANAFSLVMRLSVNDWSMLLMGDCDKETEQTLVREADLACDLLRVAHHGSAATTQEVFLERADPRLALVSVGRNDFGHPAPSLLNRLENQSVPLMRTDQNGALTVQMDQGRCLIKTRIP